MLLSLLVGRATIIHTCRAGSLALLAIACSRPNPVFDQGGVDGAPRETPAADVEGPLEGGPLDAAEDIGPAEVLDAPVADQLGDVDVPDGLVVPDGPGVPDGLVVPDGPLPSDATDVPQDVSPPRDAGPLAVGLVLRWRFDEAQAASTATDSSGNGLHGTYVGSAAQTFSAEHAPTGFPNPASRRFSAVDHAVVLESNFARLRPTTGISVSVWYRSAVTTRADLVSFSSDYFIRLMPPALEFARRKPPNASGTQNYLTATANAPTANDDRWHHAVGTSRPEATALWLDGVRISQDTLVSEFRYTAGENQVCAGRAVSGVRNFVGWLDDVRIYDRVLTDDEIRALARGEE